MFVCFCFPYCCCSCCLLSVVRLRSAIDLSFEDSVLLWSRLKWHRHLNLQLTSLTRDQWLVSLSLINRKYRAPFMRMTPLITPADVIIISPNKSNSTFLHGPNLKSACLVQQLILVTTLCTAILSH